MAVINETNEFLLQCIGLLTPCTLITRNDYATLTILVVNIYILVVNVTCKCRVA